MAFLKKEQTDLAIQDFLLIFAESFKLLNKDEVNNHHHQLQQSCWIEKNQ
jgi:hypothetical protein